MSKKSIIIISITATLLILVMLYFTATPAGVAVWNNWLFNIQKADDTTRYDTIKKVEDTCRAMIASYNADKLTYEQYKESENSEKQSWAEQVKMRANKTAASYNEYILKNEFVWKGNVPQDIKRNLGYIE